MADALAITEASMTNDLHRMKIISHNLANTNTVGFKREMQVNRTFTDYISIHTGVLGRVNQSIPVALPTTRTETDYHPGSLRFTGNPLDIALESDGFLEVMTDHGPVYTRRGNLKLDARGRLVSNKGFPVTVIEGDVRLATSEPVINKNGEIWEGDRRIGQLRIVRFENMAGLANIGAGMYQATGEAAPVPIDNGQVRQGYEEAPNIGMTGETIRMIETVRHYEASQKVIQGYNQMLDTSISVLGKF